MSDALKSQGILFKRGDGGGTEVFTTIGEVVGFDGIGSGSSAEIDVTHFESTAKEWLTGLPDEGEITLDVNFVPSDSMQAALWTDRANSTLRNFRVELTDSPATIFTFAAYVKSFAIGARPDDKIAASIGLRVSGAVTWS